MQRVVLDADVIIDYTRNANLGLEVLLEKNYQRVIKLFAPSVVVSELMTGQETRKSEKLEKLRRFFKKVEFVPLTYDLAERAGFLLREQRDLKLADAIVAATCLFLNAKLATRNIKDFQGIEGLKFYTA